MDSCAIVSGAGVGSSGGGDADVDGSGDVETRELRASSLITSTGTLNCGFGLPVPKVRFLTSGIVALTFV